MDECVVNYYRKLLKAGFLHAGRLETPTIFLDTVGEKIRICGHTPSNYLHLYINISQGILEEIKYLCTCDPTTNVVAEILCCLVEKKTIKEALSLSQGSFSQELGGGGEDFLKKVRGIQDLLIRGLDRYTSCSSTNSS